MDKKRLVRELERIVGKGMVIHHPDDLLVYEYDGSVDRGLPLAVVFPASAQQVSQVVSLACQEGVPVIPRGAGTGLSGGAIAAEGGIQVALTRMRAILEVDAANRTATVEPGLVNLDLSTATARLGLYYAPDPSSQRACTIGGNVAENAGGPHCLRYGVTTNHVLALEVVLEDGSVTWLGDGYRGRPGYDLVGALVGSEGMMGVVTKAMVRLLPLPESVRTLLAVFPEMDQACAAVTKIIGSGLVPTAIEMMDRLTIRAVETAMKSGYPTDAGAVLLVEVDGLAEEVDEASRQIEGLCRGEGATDVKVASDAAERERLWAGRKGALGALGVLAPNYYLVDGVVPRTRLLEVLRRVGEVSAQFGLPIANVFHAGDGNLHPCILFDERQPGHLARVVEAGGEILKACVAVGGTLTGEHGVGIEKKAYMPLVFTNADLEAMLKLKRAFAPRGLFNPAKVFPGGPSCGEMPQRAAIGRAGAGAWV
ncbi:MAG: FAD-linked oxidase C-terminal domain-containing protein [Dehalococcoidia bacterium]|nr:FAD-linked oxidase C-terminal domain-containing protein [Dehalococcoidia bacterium]